MSRTELSRQSYSRDARHGAADAAAGLQVRPVLRYNDAPRQVTAEAAVTRHWFGSGGMLAPDIGPGVHAILAKPVPAQPRGLF